MKIRKSIFVFLITASMVALTSVLMPQPVQAQCGDLPGQLPCPPKKKKSPTLPPPTSTFTATPTSTATATPPTVAADWIQTAVAETLTAEPSANPYSVAPAGPVFVPTYATATAWYLTVEACWQPIYLTAEPIYGSLTAEAIADSSGCYPPTSTPSPVSTIFIPPVAGPTFVPPGVKNVLILVLIIGVLSGGTFLILRGFRPSSPNRPRNPNVVNPGPINDGSAKADDLNPQPLPPKGITDGSQQFDKTSPLHGSEDIGGGQLTKK